MFQLRRAPPSPTVLARGRLALSLTLAVLAGSPPGTATPLAGPGGACTGQEHERLRELLRTVASRPQQVGSVGYWTRAGTGFTYFGRYASNVTLEVAVFTTRTPAPGDGFEGRFGSDARTPLPRRGRSAFFDEIAVPPSLELQRLDTATLRLPRTGEVSVRVHTWGCYGVLLLHPWAGIRDSGCMALDSRGINRHDEPPPPPGPHAWLRSAHKSSGRLKTSGSCARAAAH